MGILQTFSATSATYSDAELNRFLAIAMAAQINNSEVEAKIDWKLPGEEIEGLRLLSAQ